MSTPYTVEELELLKQRAALLSTSPADTTQREVFQRVVVVGLGRERLGIPIAYVKELLRAPPIVKLPIARKWIVGIVQVRGDIVLALDLTKMLDLGSLNSREPFLALLSAPYQDLGFLFDSVIDVRDVFVDELSTELSEVETDPSIPFLGTTKDLVMILDMERLLSSPKLIVDESTQLWSAPSRLREAGRESGETR